jgi:hypothetical protein
VNILQAPHVQDARAIVRGQLKSKSVWSYKDKRAAGIVCSSYDVAAILIFDFKEKIIPLEPILKNWGPSIVDCRNILDPYIRGMRENSGPEYWDGFDELYKAATKWAIECLIKARGLLASGSVEAAKISAEIAALQKKLEIAGLSATEA